MIAFYICKRSLNPHHKHTYTPYALYQNMILYFLSRAYSVYVYPCQQQRSRSPQDTNINHVS